MQLATSSTVSNPEAIRAQAFTALRAAQAEVEAGREPDPSTKMGRTWVY